MRYSKRNVSLPKPSDTSRPSIRTGKTARFPPLIIAKDYERQTEALEEAIEWLQAEKQEVGNGVNVENPLLAAFRQFPNIGKLIWDVFNRKVH